VNGLTNNLGRLTIKLAEFLAPHGWQLLLCNGGSMSPDPRHDPNRILREQQVKFTRAPPEKAATTCFRLFFLFCLIFMDFLIERNLTKSQHKLDDYVCLIQQLKAAAPLLLIELRTIPTSDDPPQWDGVIEICGPDTNGVHAQLHGFITKCFTRSGCCRRLNGHVTCHFCLCDCICWDEILTLRYMNGSLPQFAPGNCDLFYVCNKFRLKPGSLGEDGRWGGYMNGESTLPEMRTEKNIET
jgi:hypothetical protein